MTPFRRTTPMRIVDSHFHYYPQTLSPWPEWFELDDQLVQMDALGREIDVVGSTGPFGLLFRLATNLNQALLAFAPERSAPSFYASF